MRKICKTFGSTINGKITRLLWISTKISKHNKIEFNKINKVDFILIKYTQKPLHKSLKIYHKELNRIRVTEKVEHVNGWDNIRLPFPPKISLYIQLNML